MSLYAHPPPSAQLPHLSKYRANAPAFSHSSSPSNFRFPPHLLTNPAFKSSTSGTTVDELAPNSDGAFIGGTRDAEGGREMRELEEEGKGAADPRAVMEGTRMQETTAGEVGAAEEIDYEAEMRKRRSWSPGSSFPPKPPLSHSLVLTRPLFHTLFLTDTDGLPTPPNLYRPITFGNSCIPNNACVDLRIPVGPLFGPQMVSDLPTRAEQEAFVTALIDQNREILGGYHSKLPVHATPSLVDFYLQVADAIPLSLTENLSFSLQPPRPTPFTNALALGVPFVFFPNYETSGWVATLAEVNAWVRFLRSDETIKLAKELKRAEELWQFVVGLGRFAKLGGFEGRMKCLFRYGGRTNGYKEGEPVYERYLHHYLSPATVPNSFNSFIIKLAVSFEKETGIKVQHCLSVSAPLTQLSSRLDFSAVEGIESLIAARRLHALTYGAANVAPASGGNPSIPVQNFLRTLPSDTTLSSPLLTLNANGHAPPGAGVSPAVIIGARQSISSRGSLAGALTTTVSSLDKDPKQKRKGQAYSTGRPAADRLGEVDGDEGAEDSSAPKEGVPNTAMYKELKAPATADEGEVFYNKLDTDDQLRINSFRHHPFFPSLCRAAYWHRKQQRKYAIGFGVATYKRLRTRTGVEVDLGKLGDGANLYNIVKFVVVWCDGVEAVTTRFNFKLSKPYVGSAVLKWNAAQE
jgi:hypothetical protein